MSSKHSGGQGPNTRAAGGQPGCESSPRPHQLSPLPLPVWGVPTLRHKPLQGKTQNVARQGYGSTDWLSEQGPQTEGRESSSTPWGTGTLRLQWTNYPPQPHSHQDPPAFQSPGRGPRPHTCNIKAKNTDKGGKMGT